MNPIFDKNLIRKYVQHLRDSGVRSSVVALKLKSIKKYIIWSADEKIIDTESFRNLSYFLDQEILGLHESFQERLQYKLKSLMPQRKQKTTPKVTEPTLKNKAYTPQVLVGYALLVILISFLGAGIYNQFFIKASTPFAFPNTLTRGTRIISFQGRLTDSLGNPIVAQTDVVFKLYNVSSGGSPLYTGSCTGGSGLTPDQDGIFNALVGQDCSMSEIPSSVFTENANVYLGVTVGSDAEMTPRQQIANVGYALNAETLQGLPPGQTPASIPYINNQGDVLMAAATAGIRSTYASATFNISSANAVTVASAGSGDVTLNASQSGTIKLQTANTDRITIVNGGNIGIGNVTNPSSFNVQIAGTVGPNATDTYDLGSISKEWRNIYGQALFQNGAAVCDALGTNCSIAGGWTDDGQVVRLTTSTDKVGIGTTNAIGKLHVTGAITGKALAVFDETGDQALFTASASGISKFIIDHAGNVGIGTTSSAASLYVSRSDGNPLMRLERTSQPGYWDFYVSNGAFNNRDLRIKPNNDTSSITFENAAGTSGVLHMRPDTIRVGINDTSPDFRLESVGSSGQGYFGVTNSVDGDIFTINANGNVGIGATNPLEKLDVQGNASVSGNLVLAGGSRAIQSTSNTSLTLGGSTTGSILLNPNNGAAGGLVAPVTTNVTDLGSSSKQFRNIYGQNIYVNGNAVCDSAGNNCPSSSGAWTLSSPYLYPTASINRIGIGTTTTSQMVSQLYVTRTLSDGALGKALAIFNQTENQDIFTASASGATKFVINSNGNVGIGSTAPGGGLEIDVNTASKIGQVIKTLDNSTTKNLTEWQSSTASVLGKVDASGNFYTAAGGASGTGTNLLTTTNYVQSRGMNLVTNGSGLLGNNYNFSNFTFDQVYTYGGIGSFKNSNFNTAVFTDELIPVDGSRYYKLSLWANSTVHATGAHAYFGVSTYDIDGNYINPQFYYKFSGSTDTTLAAQLNPGDTTVTLTDATGWNNAGAGHQRNFAWYGYTNSFGYTYPDYTYSRNNSSNYSDFGSNGAWNTSGISGNVITLRSAWSGPTVLAGTAVRNSQSGSSYNYIAASNVDVPNTWTNYSGYIGGWDTTGSGSSNKFPYGTASVKLLFLLNRDVAGNTTNVSNIWFSELTDASASTPGIITLGNQTFGTGDKSFSGNVGIGVTNPVHKLELVADTTAAGGIGFGTDTELYRSAANTLALASGDSLNLVSGALQVGGTTVITSGSLIQAANGSSAAPSLSFSGDSNTGIYGTGSDVLRFATGATDRMTIDATGKVGIGTTAPGVKLDVYGDIKAEDVSGRNIGFANTGGGNVFYRGMLSTSLTSGLALRIRNSASGNTDPYIIFGSSAGGVTDALTVNVSSGNVGIGTTTALEKLDVQGNASVSGNFALAGSSRSIQSTANNTLTIGGNTTGDIVVKPQNTTAGGGIIPGATNVTDLGRSGLQYRNIYGQALYVNGVAVCDANGNNCPTGSSAWTLASPNLYPQQSLYRVGIGTTTTSAMISQLYVTRTISDGALGKALAIFNHTENQDLITASASGTPRFTVTNAGNLQFHQASSITTTTGNLTLDSTGGTTTISDNAVVTGTSDLQGTIADSTGNVVIADTTDIGSATTGLRVDTSGNVIDIDGNIVLNDITDIGSATTGINITAAGAISDTDGNVVINDTTDIGSSSTGINVTTAGALSDIDGNLVLNDQTDIGSATTGLRVTTAGGLSDIDGNLAIADTTDITGGLTVSQYATVSATLNVGYATAKPGPGNGVFSGNVGIGTSNPTHQLELGAGTTAAQGINFGTDVDFYRSAADTLALGTGDSFNIVSGNLQFGGTTVLNSSRQLSNIAGVTTSLTPTAANTYALGTATTNQYSTIYGQSIFVNGSAVCDAAGNNCPTGLYVNLQAATPGSQQTGNLNISGAALVGYLADTSNSNYGIDPAGTSNFGGFSLKVTGASLLALDSGNVGIGTGTPVGKLHVDATAVGKALAIFNDNGTNQALLTASASGVTKFIVDHNGNVGIGIISPTHALELAASTAASGGINFGTDVDLYRGATNRLDLGTGDDLNLVSGNIQIAATTVINSSRQLNNIAGVTTSLTPTAANTYALGTATTNQYSTIYGQSIFVNGSAVCDAAGNNCPAGASSWTLTGNALYPTASTSRIGIGSTTTANMVSQFYLTRTLTDGSLGKALAIFDQSENQPIIAASASGSTKFIIDYTGNVGIGTTTPAGKLTISQASTTSSDGLYITDASANTGRLYVGSSGSFRLQAGSNNTQLVLHSAGNVGIGTTNPLAQFSVGSTSQFQVNSTGNLTAINGVTYSWPGSQGGASTVLTNNGSGTLTWASVGTLTGTGANGQVAFWNGTTTQAGTDSFFWDNTNNLLGIGLNTPVAKLHLDGAVKGKALAIFNETGDQDVFVASASGTNVFAIKHNGNVGIGTTAPGAKLEIGGTTSTISNTAGNINITPSADLVLTSGNLGIGASPVAGGKLYLDTTNANTGNTVTMNIGNIASTTQNNWTTLNMQNGGTGFFDLELVRGIVNQQGINTFLDDFTGISLDTTRWANAAAGTGATCTSTFTAGVVGGILRQTTGTAAGAGCSLRTQTTLTNGFYKQDNNPIFEAAVKMGSTANTQRAYFGFTNTAPTGDANTAARHAWIGKRAADTVWQCVTGNGTTETFTSTGVSISTSVYQRLRVQISNGTTPQVVCSVDGTAVSVTATMPGTGQAMDMFLRTESTGTSASHDIDYVRTWQDDPPNGIPPAPVVQNNNPDLQTRADVAENYPTAPGVTLEPGDVVRLDNGRLNKTTSEHDTRVLGVISTNPGVILGTDDYVNVSRLALNGRIPTKVSTKNGPIYEGDYLTTSDIPGIAVKATSPGIVIGKAMESYTNSDLNAVGKVLMFSNLTWYDPQIAISNDGTLTLSQNPASILPQPDYNSQVTVTRATASTVTNANGDVLSATTGYAKIVAGTILTGLTDTQNAIISNILSAKTIITTSITSASGSFTSLTSTTFTALDGTIQKLTVSQKITSPVVDTDNLKVSDTAQINNVETNTIQPEADNVTIDLSKPTNQGALANIIIKGMEGKTVTTLDAAGNATFSGTITSNKVETKDASVSGQLAAGSLNTNEASVSGTLTAREIKADNIDALANNLGLTQNSIASQSSNLQQLSSNVNDIQKILTDLKNQPLPDPAYYQNMNQPVQIATQPSALNLEKLTVSDNANMYDVSIAHNLSVGSMIITDGSILSLSWELKLSSLSTLNLFDGGVIIAKDGTITTQGSVIAKGGIKTNEIEAITPKDNVNIKLASNDVIGQTDVHNTKLAVQNNQGLEVASIDASGSAQFKDLSLDKYLDATNSAAVIPAATNFTSNGIYAPALQTDRKTIGVGRMPASQSEIIIYNEKVNEGSLIYVTPTSALQNKNLFIADKHTCAEGDTACKPYFKVSISGGPTATDVTFNWWIVN